MRSISFEIGLRPDPRQTKRVSAARMAFMGRLLAMCGLFMCGMASSHAAAPCTPAVGQIATAEGVVEFQRSNSSDWKSATPDTALCQGDTVRTGERSRATLALANQTILRVDQSSAVLLSNVVAQKEERSIIDLLRGAFQSFSRKPRRMAVNTPYLNGSIEGTEFVFRVEDGQTTLTVFEGTVIASNSQGKVPAHAGAVIAAKAGQAPVALTVVRPRDAAQWSLYYPPIIAAPGAASAAPGSAQQALYSAAQNLTTGRVSEARADIGQALARDPKLGAALALRAVINVVQNNKKEALSDAQQAVSLSPDATGPLIALSYVQQANTQISDARDSLLQATQKQPQDALAWARLAELQLMLGERERSAEAASKAAALAPNLARPHLATGFAALTSFHIADARIAFEKAIALDPADPLPHLGLGLAKINAGALEDGRREIEIAVALDSNSALLRAYLGKAYFEETRAPLDGEQFEIAKQLDPLDPTAFFYDGIRKQTKNRPIEALADLEKSAELNDNRAVYRSRLLLDKDRAARGASLARAYGDLGFEERAINEAAQSLGSDPSNASAHRFLADSYQGVRRVEVARVSEQFQAQMLQDINIQPVQPSTSEANLNIGTQGGPASAGFNEFTPLFQRNQARASVSGFTGSNDTRGGELAVSGIYDRLSLSAGAFEYKTDGWRPNNQQDVSVYNLFGQIALTDKLNVQAEFRRRDTATGDLGFRFNPDEYLSVFKDDRQQESARIGIRYSASEASHFLLSYIHGDQKIRLNKVTDDGAGTVTTENSTLDQKTDQSEAQYIHQWQKSNLIVGAAQNSVRKNKNKAQVAVDICFPAVPFCLDTQIASAGSDITQTRGYAYANIRPSNAVLWTIGASHDQYEQDNGTKVLKKNYFNPKLGVQWDIRNDLRLRATAFSVVKPALSSNQTLE